MIDDFDDLKPFRAKLGRSEKTSARRSFRNVKRNIPGSKGSLGRPSPKTSQRVVVKTTSHKMGKEGFSKMESHLAYLLREGAAGKDKEASFFGSDAKEPPGKQAFLDRVEADRHAFRVILSPENGHKLDLEEYTRKVMKGVERDVRSRLDWIAVVHKNTDNPHVHLVIRGKYGKNLDKDLFLKRDYITKGFRRRAQKVATQLLGPRTLKQRQEALLRETTKNRFTSLDKDILKARSSVQRIDLNQITDDSTKRSLLRKRLEHLEALKLASRTHKSGEVWTLHSDIEKNLRALSKRNDIIKRMHDAGQNRSSDWRMDLPNEPVVAKVLYRGLDNEHLNNHFLIAQGVNGKTYYIDRDQELADSAGPGNFVILAKGGPSGREALLTQKSLEESISYIGPTALDHPLLKDSVSRNLNDRSSLAQSIARSIDARQNFLRKELELDAPSYPQLRAKELDAKRTLLSKKHVATPFELGVPSSHRGVLIERLELESGNYLAFKTDDNRLGLVPENRYLKQAFEEGKEVQLSVYKSNDVIRHAVSSPILTQNELSEETSKIAGQRGHQALLLEPGLSVNGWFEGSESINGRNYAVFRTETTNRLALVPSTKAIETALESAERVNLSTFERDGKTGFFVGNPKLSREELNELSVRFAEKTQLPPLEIPDSQSNYRGKLIQKIELEVGPYYAFRTTDNRLGLIPGNRSIDEAFEKDEEVRLSVYENQKGLNHIISPLILTQDELSDHVAKIAEERIAEPLTLEPGLKLNGYFEAKTSIKGRDYAVFWAEAENKIALVPITKAVESALDGENRINLSTSEKDGRTTIFVNSPRLGRQELNELSNSYANKAELEPIRVPTSGGDYRGRLVQKVELDIGRYYAFRTVDDRISLVPSSRSIEEAFAKDREIRLSIYENSYGLNHSVSPPILTQKELSAHTAKVAEQRVAEPLVLTPGQNINGYFEDKTTINGRDYAVFWAEAENKIALVPSTKAIDAALESEKRINLSTFDRDGRTAFYVDNPKLSREELNELSKTYVKEAGHRPLEVPKNGGNYRGQFITKVELDIGPYYAFRTNDGHVGLVPSNRSTDQAFEKGEELRLSVYESRNGLNHVTSPPILTQEELKNQAGKVAKVRDSEPLTLKPGVKENGYFEEKITIKGRDYAIFRAEVDNRIALVPSTKAIESALEAESRINLSTFEKEGRTAFYVNDPRLGREELNKLTERYAEKAKLSPCIVPNSGGSFRGHVVQKLELEVGQYYAFRTADNRIGLIPSHRSVEDAFNKGHEVQLSVYKNHNGLNHRVSPPILSQEELSNHTAKIADERASKPLRLTPGLTLNGTFEGRTSINGRDYAVFQPEAMNRIALVPSTKAIEAAINTEERVNLSTFSKDEKTLFSVKEPQLSKMEINHLSEVYAGKAGLNALHLQPGTPQTGQVVDSITVDGRSYHVFQNQKKGVAVIPASQRGTEALKSQKPMTLKPFEKQGLLIISLKEKSLERGKGQER